MPRLRRPLSERKIEACRKAGRQRRATARLCTATLQDGRICRAYAARGHLFCRAHLGEVYGRPPALADPELEERILEAVERGLPLYRAALLCGLDPTTVYRWIARAQEGKEPYASFIQKVVAAESRLELYALERFWEQAKPRDVLEFLARRFPKEWEPRSVLELEAKRRELEQVVGPDWLAKWLRMKGLLEESDS